MVDTAGGSLRAAVNIAEAMAGDGTSVTFSAPVVRGRRHRTIELMDARVERQLFPATRLAERFGGSLRQCWWLWRNVRRFDHVQVHSLFELAAVYAIAVCTIRRVPILLWPHGALYPADLLKHERFKRLVGPIVTRRLLDRCSALLFTTTDESRAAVTYGSSVRHAVVPLPVAPLSIENADPTTWRERHGVPPDVPVVLFLGRIDYKKRLPLLIEAVAQMDHRNAHLVVVGDGPASERALVDATVNRCGVEERVSITGWLEGSERVEAFAVADVFALLSDFENFGLAVVEAMSTGCPVVISDQLSLSEDLEQAGAVLRVERDAAVAARAIDRLLAHPDEAAAMGARGRDLVRARFAPSAVAERLREVVS